MMLTADDETLIARAVLKALGQWSLICFMTAVAIWLFSRIILGSE